jgi:BTB/POZ domain
VILKDVQYNDLKTMVDFMYYGEVNVSTEQLPQILKTAEMLKIKGLAEMPDAASVTKSDSKSSDHTDGNQSVSGVESMWGSTESQQQQVQQQYHTIRRTPSPSNMSPATRRKRLRRTSTGSGSANQSTSIERIQEEQIQHHQQQQATIDGRMLQKYSQQQQQTVDVPLSTFSNVTQTGAIANVRSLKINSSPDGQLQHQQDSQEHIDESQHITEMVRL